MVRIGALLAAFALPALVGCSDGPATQGGTGSSDALASRAERADVEAFVRAYVDVVDQRDTTALRDMYAEPDRFVWIEDGAVRYQSVDEVIEALGAFGPDASLETELEDFEAATLSGGGVHAWARFTTSVTQGGQRYSFGGLMSFILEPTETGWSIVGGHVSSQ